MTARVTSIAPSLDPAANTGVVEAVVPNLTSRVRAEHSLVWARFQYGVADDQLLRAVGALVAPEARSGADDWRP